MNSGPGSDPRLHESAQSYSHRPVLIADFITSAAGADTTLHLLLFEVNNRAYGQVLAKHHPLSFPEHPVAEDGAPSPLSELLFESRDHGDPIVVVHNTVEALDRAAAELTGGEPVLERVDVTAERYLETGKHVANEYQSPVVEFEGLLRGERYPAGDRVAVERAGFGSP